MYNMSCAIIKLILGACMMHGSCLHQQGSRGVGLQRHYDRFYGHLRS